MARVVRTEVTVTSTAPVEICFKCAKCGKEVRSNRVLLVIACTAAFMAIGGSLLYLSGKERLFFLYVLLGCLAVGVPLLLYDRKISRRAYDDPALMERAFKSVLNDAVYADMTPYGLGMVHVGCIGVSMSVQDQLARQEAIEKSLIGEAESEVEA